MGIPVAYLGPAGTYTHQAAIEYFSERRQVATFIPEKTIRKVVEAVSGVKVSLGVVPAENSTFGSVAETYDALVNADILGSAFIVGEHVLPINHALIVRRGVCVGDIKAVYSHPQALGQCANYLGQNLPDASKHEVPSTGAAVDLLLGPRSDQNTRIAAIASAQSTKQHSEIEILASNIQDLKQNGTRFFVLANCKLTWATQSGSFMIRYTPPYSGTATVGLDLMDVIPLSAIKRIDRRPSSNPAPFHDTVFVEVDIRLLPEDGNGAVKTINSALSKAKEAGAEAAWLGTW